MLTDDIRQPRKGAIANPFGLPLHLRQMGESGACGHRSGWRYVLNSLNAVDIQNPLTVRLDDFVERTFQREDSDHVWNEPWVGIFHHPPNLPAWLDPTAVAETILSTPRFTQSLKNLRGCIALSDYLGSWLKGYLKVPVLVALHPSEIPERKFDIERWTSGDKRRVIQVGWYGRNCRAIYQLNAGENIQKVHLLQDQPWIRQAMVNTDTYAPTRLRPAIGSVEVFPRVSDEEYDDLFASSVVFCEYFDVSASNTVIEAIARNCPIIVNRHPALIEYLGWDYPMFYSSLEEVGPMLQDLRRVESAHKYLMEMPKDWLGGEHFAHRVLNFCRLKN